MKLTLIGMSNIGKTYWSKKLENAGFLRFGCDDLIEKKLGTADLSNWLGQPFDKRYKKNSSVYLHYEKEVVEEIISSMEKLDGSIKIVVDTTGSLIYLNESLISKLKKYTKFVYLDLPEDIKEIMCRNYFKTPKPVIWGESYKITNGFSQKESLFQCYPKLLNFRLKKYKSLSDITLDYYLLRNKKISAGDFINSIKYKNDPL